VGSCDSVVWSVIVASSDSVMECNCGFTWLSYGVQLWVHVTQYGVKLWVHVTQYGVQLWVHVSQLWSAIAGSRDSVWSEIVGSCDSVMECNCGFTWLSYGVQLWVHVTQLWSAIVGSCDHRTECTTGFHKFRAMFWAADQLLAYEGLLCRDKPWQSSYGSPDS